MCTEAFAAFAYLRRPVSGHLFPPGLFNFGFAVCPAQAEVPPILGLQVPDFAFQTAACAGEDGPPAAPGDVAHCCGCSACCMAGIVNPCFACPLARLGWISSWSSYSIGLFRPLTQVTARGSEDSKDQQAHPGKPGLCRGISAQ